VARDRRRDETVSCGPGVDFAIVDPRDRPVRRGRDRCERVDDGTRRRPRAGSEIYADPAACAEPLQTQLPAAHRMVPLEDAVILPSSTPENARTSFDGASCSVELTATGTRSGTSATAEVGGTVFEVAPKRQAGPDVDLQLPKETCPPGGARAAQTNSRGLRVRSRRGKGRWRVIGGYSNGGSYSTDWSTVEECDRTITVVHEGTVDVFDKTRGVTVKVSAGERYEALAPGAQASSARRLAMVVQRARADLPIPPPSSPTATRCQSTAKPASSRSIATVAKRPVSRATRCE
jgi:hypothetical protein